MAKQWLYNGYNYNGYIMAGINLSLVYKLLSLFPILC